MNPPKTIADLCHVTGLGDKAVRRAIRDGELPGQVIGEGRNCRYVIPDTWFFRYCNGDWQPRQKPEPIIDFEPPQMLRRRAS